MWAVRTASMWWAVVGSLREEGPGEGGRASPLVETLGRLTLVLAELAKAARDVNGSDSTAVVETLHELLRGR